MSQLGKPNIAGWVLLILVAGSLGAVAGELNVPLPISMLGGGALGWYAASNGLLWE